jgi:hypothetical protein
LYKSGKPLRKGSAPADRGAGPIAVENNVTFSRARTAPDNAPAPGAEPTGQKVDRPKGLLDGIEENFPQQSLTDLVDPATQVWSVKGTPSKAGV